MRQPPRSPNANPPTFPDRALGTPEPPAPPRAPQRLSSPVSATGTPSRETSPSGDGNPFVAFVRKYQTNPVAFVEDCLGATPIPWQRVGLNLICVQKSRRIAVRSGHGVGKTTLLAWAMIHTLLFAGECKVVCTAPAAPTLFDGLMAETRTWISKLPPVLKDLLDPTSDHIRLKAMPDAVFISARTSSTDKPEALAGIHAPRVLLVVDEASGVPEAVYQSAGGSMSTRNATTVLIGNPTRAKGYFFECFRKFAELWDTLHVSCIGNENVSLDYIEEQAARWGRDSNEFRIRVLGEFPLDDGSTYISEDLARRAAERDFTPSDHTPEVWGVDVAREGGDRTAVARRRGPVVMEVKTWAGKDLMGSTGAIKALWDATPDYLRPEEILVDAIGLGAGVADRLKEMDLPVRAVNVAESVGELGHGARLRDELWYRMREALEDHGLAIPNDETLIEEISGPQADYLSNGRLKVEGKREMKRRGLRSPDMADAVMLTLHSRVSPYDSVSTSPRASRHGWNRRGSLRRDVGAVV